MRRCLLIVFTHRMPLLLRLISLHTSEAVFSLLTRLFTWLVRLLIHSSEVITTAIATDQMRHEKNWSNGAQPKSEPSLNCRGRNLKRNAWLNPEHPSSPMMPRRSFLARTLLGAAGLATMPCGIVNVSRPSLWIADSEPAVACAIQLLARQCGFTDVNIFGCKRTAIQRLRTEITKPTLVVTDYWSGQMQGDEFIRLARQASPNTKVILFSAVVGNRQRWIAVAGVNAPRPDAFVEKPSTRKLMTTLCQMR